MFDKLDQYLTDKDFYYTNNGNYIHIDTSDQGFDYEYDEELKERGIVFNRGDFVSVYD